MSEQPFLCIGHRGARGHAPENTLLGIDTGIALGAQMIEVDVQLHPSGELLLMHDLWLERTTSGQGLLTQMPLPALRTLDAGQGERIPSLREAIERIARRVPLNIELKTWDGTAQAVAALLREFLARGWQASDFLVSSFHLPELARMRDAAPEIPRGALYCGVPLDGLGSAQALGAHCINLSAEFVDAGLVRAAKAQDMRVYVYTVNLPAEIASLRAMGVDGVFSDYPERVRGA